MLWGGLPTAPPKFGTVGGSGDLPTTWQVTNMAEIDLEHQGADLGTPTGWAGQDAL